MRVTRPRGPPLRRWLGRPCSPLQYRVSRLAPLPHPPHPSLTKSPHSSQHLYGHKAKDAQSKHCLERPCISLQCRVSSLAAPIPHHLPPSLPLNTLRSFHSNMKRAHTDITRSWFSCCRCSHVVSPVGLNKQEAMIPGLA